MTLDQNLFTLQIKPSPADPTLVDLADSSGNVFYRKERSFGVGYNVSLYDFISQSLLVTATAPSPTGRVKTIELQNPSVPVELKASGTFSVKWAFSWKGHEFEWKREEECYIIRKPDPPVLIAITTRKESNRIQPATVQILDYNLDRFDIEDRKGLELVILTSLLTFLDSADANFPHMIVNDEQSLVPGVITPPPPPGGGGRRKSMWTALSPPRKATSSGVDLVAQLLAPRLVIHEVTVHEEGEIEDYAKFCWRLLRDEAIAFITIRSGHSSQVQKVLEVVEATKRFRFEKGKCL
ncbi:MAG: hypothetical protein NXY57DRAFT_901520 [Lentinula lateritia]|uniref:Uncharacterized protein n=1 Tax=Lentinula lateritia TaxID=40482 RepID=A0ABQ8VT55_9AGAR|nr:MAG: hypothetical protein NXY57DRAFT_901520 [Lentinula lateritia]KAJ4498404.1 hypothetical protein C8R41DRAFT_757546 [Lentinula lateritia]